MLFYFLNSVSNIQMFEVTIIEDVRTVLKVSVEYQRWETNMRGHAPTIKQLAQILPVRLAIYIALQELLVAVRFTVSQ